MENDIRQNKNIQIEENLNNQNDINNKNKLYDKENIFNYDKKEKINSEYLSIFDKYKLQNDDGLSNDIKENKKIDKEKSIKNELNVEEEQLEQEFIRKNNDYTNQINEIINKNFKKEINSSQNIYNLNLNNNSNNKYLELDRERKLLLLKNIELEKEINNLNNFVDIESKYNQNKVTKNRIKKNNIESYNYKIKRNNKKEINYKKEINEAQNMIKILDKRINKLKENININYSMNNNKCQEKIKEVKIWRETFYEEYYKYKNLLKDLKENLNKDRKIYIDVISKMKEKANENIKTIFDNYKSQIIENDKKLNFLKKENEKLINKENKVKEIYLYNFK